jgi:hypothetical protein
MKVAISLKKSYNQGEVSEVKIFYRYLNVSDGALYTYDGMVFNS